MTPAKEETYLFRFNKKYQDLFRDVIKINGFKNGYRSFWMKTLYNQHRMARRREKSADEGLRVPPVLIYSITNRCNLQCKGCYAHSQKRVVSNELSVRRMGKVIDEASELGIGVVMIAGGEPLMRSEILHIASNHKEIIFPIFTNGVLLDETRMQFFRENKHLIPVLSLEGSREMTDGRRGQGLFEVIKKRTGELHKHNQFYGLSITLTSKNFESVVNHDMMKEFNERGCKLFFLVEYVPTSEADEDLCLTPEQKSVLTDRLNRLRKEIPALFISLPGDEEQYGGCLAAGRAFVHLSSDGQLEPCPFAPYSDVDLNYMTLKEALGSDFLEQIRNNHQNLSESKGGCTLWENREWVEKQLQKSYSISA